MSPYWSYVLTALGVLGLLLAGSRKRVGWALGLAAQPLWVLYAVMTHQWGFIISAVIYGGVYLRNWLRWRREALQPSAPVMTAPPWLTFREQERRPSIPPPPAGWSGGQQVVASAVKPPRATVRHASYRGSGLALCGAPVGVMTVDQRAGERYDCGACRSREEASIPPPLSEPPPPPPEPWNRRFRGVMENPTNTPPRVADTFPPPSYGD